MSSNAKFSFKVLINKQKTKVLFAEANNDFVDVLISFLTLPLGRIVQVLEKHCGDKPPVIGSLTTLYKGLVNLDCSHFWTDVYKQMLINPITSFSDECHKLKVDINETQPDRYFACEDFSCDNSKMFNISMYHGYTCNCGKSLTREIRMRDVNDGGAFIVDGAASFIISDELLICPNEAGCSVIQILSKLGIADTDLGEIVNVTFGFNEVINLLKALLFSKTPLTDTILNKGQIDYTWPFDPLNLLPKVDKKDAKNSCKKIDLKVIVQKSTNKLLFAQANANFINSLFSLLTIPLGEVVCLMDGSSLFPNIDNLIKSMDRIEWYFKSYSTKTRLIDISKYNTLPFTEGERPKVYFYEGECPNSDFMSFSNNAGGPREEVYFCNFKRGKGSYVKRPGTYMVNDDLSVTPLCMLSSLSSLNALRIPFSDVTELVVNVGPEEVLNILKASLVSKSALSNGLSHLLMKQPKTEQ
ncbi:hypothetical protein CASFOL_020021 [Castilleja foliolosa]|uniref:DUF674 family protein n=1 Tax=Castilleja foliolosa TaxID=1961234 RepID=A0ABD3D0Y7_9LAMI